MATSRSDVPPLPQGAVIEELTEARRRAVESLLEAEDLEREARAARRRANAQLKHYENLLLEHGGQLKLPLGEEWESSRS